MCVAATRWDGPALMFLQVDVPTHIEALLIDANDARREMLNLTLGRGDIALKAAFKTADEALAFAADYELAIYYAESATDGVYADVESLAAGDVPALLILLNSDEAEDIEKLLNSGADHVLPVGPGADRLSVATVNAVAAGRKVRKVVRDLERVERTLTESKMIARAKMILIARHGIGEDDAHRRVQKMSMERNLPLADMARQIVDAQDLLC